MTGRAELSADQYRAIADYLERQVGIRLGLGKEYLVVSRLAGLLREHGLADFDGLLRELRLGGRAALQAAVVDAMTTNETFWFRDPAHYQILIDVLMRELPPGPVRIWSAAASTGQEPYSIAFALHDARDAGSITADRSWEILGTDISSSALSQAEAGRYCGISAGRGLTTEQRQRFFDADGDCIQVQPRYRRGVRFRHFNLLSSFEGLGRFDVIFCRNVLIYFSQERKRDILKRFHRALSPQGGLFLGSTESMSDHADLFRMQRHSTGLVYRKI
ncbi:MAG: protein-glutamate O-methyltransferase CheR [Gammaproteobacteria bacterium]|nr:MAG: protein-glutamate O-methyltransferase CheR [Gammaproteobacteria bacterium]